MSKKSTINVKERYSDGEIDLSLSNLSEVPVKEIANFPKTVSLDLSNNILKTLPNNFPTLTFLVRLDLSKNELRELPKDFGKLVKLRHLDLYQNKLEKLPISFGQLTNLKFLDLKDNLLNPATAKVAGPCIDNKGCQQCARDIVRYFGKLFMEEERNRKGQEEKQQQLAQQQQQRAKEEKKKLRKEKQKQKMEKRVPLKQPKLVPREIKQESDTKSESSCSCRLWFNLFLFGVIFLWFSFALNLPFTRPFVPTIQNYYTLSLEKLPAEYQSYGHYVGHSVSVLQDGTRNISERCIQAVSNSEAFQSLVAKVRSLL